MVKEKIPEWEPVEMMPKGKINCSEICPYASIIKKIQKDIDKIRKQVLNGKRSDN